ncbi:PINIT domain-containing protein [Lyophyllum atratum]|nr:PINIT domain-containing protein [Lyophyllum atratum]
MTSTDVWSDFDAIRHTVKNNIVDRLKQILSGFNEECSTHIAKTGKKQEVIDRIVATLDLWRAQNMEDRWIKGKAIITQVRNTGVYTPSRMTVNPAVLPPPTTHNHSMTNMMKNAPYGATPGSSSIARYDPYAPPRKPSGSIPSSSAAKPTGIRFKESPFFQIDQAASSVTECPESTSATDRRQQTLSFTLTNDHLAKLKSPNSKYQLRLFCTSSIFYPGPHSFRSNHVPCPIEFPPTCEVRVNNVQLTANLKGLKKKPGTAPPPDIGKYCRLTTLANKIEMVYVNSQQPVQSKKYYIVVMLVDATTVERLVADLKATKYKSSHHIRQSMIASLSEDDDIVAGPQKMSLKCPLSYMRVNTPCRSLLCVHPQCFDATSWFSVMEQTTTWLCPTCERALDSKDLIIDGYFDEILKQTPESVEDVIVEADGEWHTSDNKYGSASWKASHPVSTAPIRKPPSVSQPASRSPSKADVNGKAKANNQEIFVLDSDDEDEGQVKRELSPSLASASQSYDGGSVPQTQSQSVIDLTADSDDDEPPPTRQAAKRKATDHEPSSTSPTEQIWKKSRIDPIPHRTASSNTVDYSTSRSAPIPPLRYADSYPGPSQPSDYPPYSTGGSSSTPNSRLSLPGISAILPGANGRWS